MSGFTKLQSSILNSSIWDESDAVRVVWITMLAMSDSSGFVESSLPGLAHQSRKSKEATIAALGVLESPDAESKNPDYEGRRIKKVEGGWLVLNYALYREQAEVSDDPKAIATRERVRRHRERKNSERYKALHGVTSVTPASASGDASASEKKKALQYETPLMLSALGEVFVSAWSDFIGDRKERRKAVTSRAAKMILNRLAEKPERAVETIRKMIEKGWTSFEWAWLDNNFGKPKPSLRRENIQVPITRR